MAMNEYDVETRGLQWYYPSQGMFMAQFQAANEGKATLLRHPQDQRQIQARLDDSPREGGVRAWNSKFDLHMAEAAGYRLPPESCWHDGMVVAKLLDERVGASLQATGDRIFGTDPWPEGAGVELEKAVKSWLTQETSRRRSETKSTGDRLVRPNYGDIPDDIMIAPVESGSSSSRIRSSFRFASAVASSWGSNTSIEGGPSW